MTHERNWATWVLAGLAVIAGILALLDAMRYLGWLPIASLGNLNFFVPSANWIGALLSAAVGVIWFVVAGWIYNLNPQGWIFVVVIAIFNLILLLLAWIGGSSWTAISLEVIVNVIALILALLPSTRAAFGQTQQRRA